MYTVSTSFAFLSLSLVHCLYCPLYPKNTLFRQMNPYGSGRFVIRSARFLPVKEWFIPFLFLFPRNSPIFFLLKYRTVVNFFFYFTEHNLTLIWMEMGNACRISLSIPIWRWFERDYCNKNMLSTVVFFCLQIACKFDWFAYFYHPDCVVIQLLLISLPLVEQKKHTATFKADTQILSVCADLSIRVDCAGVCCS